MFPLFPEMHPIISARFKKKKSSYAILNVNFEYVFTAINNPKKNKQTNKKKKKTVK